MTKHLITFNPADLLALLTHYTEGQVPRDAECVSLDRHPMLQNIFRLVCRAKHWPNAPTALIGGKLIDGMLQPLEFRYEGKKVLTWDDKGAQPEWRERRELKTKSRDN